MTFKPGDVVMLKSGGERMTLIKVEGEDAVCIWQETAKCKPTIQREAKYPLIALTSGARTVGVMRLGRA